MPIIEQGPKPALVLTSTATSDVAVNEQATGTLFSASLTTTTGRDYEIQVTIPLLQVSTTDTSYDVEFRVDTTQVATDSATLTADPDGRYVFITLSVTNLGSGGTSVDFRLTNNDPAGGPDNIITARFATRAGVMYVFESLS